MVSSDRWSGYLLSCSSLGRIQGIAAWITDRGITRTMKSKPHMTSQCYSHAQYGHSIFILWLLKSLLLLLLLLISGNVPASEVFECAYHSADTKDEIIEKHCLTVIPEGQANRSDGDAWIADRVLSKSYYDEQGLSYVISRVGVFYVNRHGLARRTLRYDNGPDYFSNGLARTEHNNKIGYFDKNLTLVIKPQYDFGFPFKEGRAVVCIGCKKQKTGEHSVVVDGKWGVIDVKGSIIVPINKSRDEIAKYL